MLEPRRAPVRPRVISPVSGETLLLEDEILSLLERGESGNVCLVGDPGTGKTTALEHLLAVLPSLSRATLHDDWFVHDERHKLVVGCGIAGTVPKDARIVYQIAPWTEDEVIEYLLAVHRQRCSCVMRRYYDSADKD